MRKFNRAAALKRLKEIGQRQGVNYNGEALDDFNLDSLLLQFGEDIEVPEPGTLPGGTAKQRSTITRYSEKGTPTMKLDRGQAISQIVAKLDTAALAAMLTDDELRRVAEQLNTPAAASAQMSARKFSERQMAEVGRVAAFGEKHKGDLKTVGMSLNQYVDAFKKRLAKEPGLTADQFTNVRR